MKLIFKKGFNIDYPHRWYIFGVGIMRKDCCSTADITIYNADSHNFPLVIHGEQSIYKFQQFMKKLGLIALEHNCEREQYTTMYLYFSDPADEAEFIMTKLNEQIEI